MVTIYCRYREISPVCVGKNRPLRSEEMTKEHLIPKTLLRNPKFKAKWMITFNPSDAPNIDISCYKCNHLKNHLADVPFAWKLLYLKRYGISCKSSRAMSRSLIFSSALSLESKQKERVYQCIIRGDIQWIGPEECLFFFHCTKVYLKSGVVVGVQDRQDKVPRKLKKKSKQDTKMYPL